MRVLTDADVATCIDLDSLLPVVAEAFSKQGKGQVERPDRPHFPIPGGTGLTMPAYIHGAAYVATKLVTVHEANPERGLPTVQAQLVLQDAETGTPAAFLDGRRVTNARTGCIGGLAAKHLTSGRITLGVIGSGTQARWQTRAIAAATELGKVRIYSRSEAREACAAELGEELDCPVEAVSSPEAAIADASVVVTATTATSPVFPPEALAPDALVIAVGAYTSEMQELPPEIFEGATCFADVPAEAAETGDARAARVREGALVPLSEAIEGWAEREAKKRAIVLSVGTAVLDAATAEYVLERAEKRGLGTELPF
ncbi:ornithine cyclodeaminase family protein [Natronomonas sp. EA1]|uniref:ornithine cyclodeaminase family protein n=1 Tax=Natronomonas sp. EA1 TaxID=3421655 RepID=UPI003EB8EB06